MYSWFFIVVLLMILWKIVFFVCADHSINWSACGSNSPVISNDAYLRGSNYLVIILCSRYLPWFIPYKWKLGGSTRFCFGRRQRKRAGWLIWRKRWSQSLFCAARRYLRLKLSGGITSSVTVSYRHIYNGEFFNTETQNALFAKIILLKQHYNI